VVSDYVGIVSAFRLKVRWQQEDVWDDQARTCAFRQLKGDYDQFEGIWTFREEEGGTRFDSSLTYEYVVPGLGAMVGKVIQGLVQKNSDAVLEAIKRRAEADH
jgi:ribosome-associated toxin RatA of RatAB toxin-antitoxin module